MTYNYFVGAILKNQTPSNPSMLDIYFKNHTSFK